MSYTKTTVTGSWPDQFLLLDTGATVGVVCSIQRNANTQALVLTVTTRQVGADGTTTVDANKHPILTEFTHTTSDAEIAANGGIDGVTKQVIMLALGETSTISVSDQYKAHVDIRQAITAAASTGQAALGLIL